MNIKFKPYRLAIGMALAANLGFAQAAELDDPVTSVTELNEPTQMMESACPVPITEPLSMEEESPRLIEIEYEVEGDTLFIVVDGIGLDQVKHFTFNGKIIDDFISDGREKGLVTIEEEYNMFLISASLPSSQAVVGGVFGVMTSNGTTVSSDIPSDLLSQSNTESSRSVRRKSYCYVTYRVCCNGCKYTSQLYLGWASSPFCGYRKRYCRDRAQQYARNTLSYWQFGLAGPQYCNCFKNQWTSVYYDTTVTGCNSYDGYQSTGLQAAHKCHCSGWTFQ